MLIQRRKFKKGLAFFFLATLFYQIGFPITAYALTSGPSSPETASFEPVNTTDMVNVQTGDFVYNIPLLEVPGPDGGYPISMSYHGGIKTSEEASWVGLGWTLNTGAINRSVSGLPDDWNGNVLAQKQFSSGTDVEIYSVSVGLAKGPATFNTGISFTNNKNKGFSVGVYTPNTGISPIGLVNTIGQMNRSISGPEIARADNLGISEKSLLRSNPLKGLGISTNSISLSRDRSQTEINGWSIQLGIGSYVQLGLSYQHRRTWLDANTNMASYGSLYTDDGRSANFNEKTFDIYHMNDFVRANLFDQPDAERVSEGALPDYDDYSISAQGLTGDIQPFAYRSHVIGDISINPQTSPQFGPRNGPAGDLYYDVISYSVDNPVLNNTNPKTNFRFVGDFSNSYRQQMNNYATGSLAAPFDNNPLHGDVGNTADIASYDAGTNYLEGSRHIDYFTFDDISNGNAKSKGFITPVVNQPVLSNPGPKAIAAFLITAENGMTYHFGLGAKSTGGGYYSEAVKNNPNDPTRYTTLNKNISSYVYTWYLTAVTGPDFVDRNNNGLADEADWGYYVNFKYGMWANKYGWRNPAEGGDSDIDNKFKFCSYGSREIYYLNAIETRTHTALFEKDVRTDGRGTAVAGANTSDAFSTASIRQMRLNRIILCKNADAATVSLSRGTTLNTKEYGQYVLDTYDLAGTDILSKAIKVTELSHDYSLSPGVVNSFTDAAPTIKSGKLTLNAIKINGKNGLSLVPPVTLKYELDDIQRKEITGSEQAGILTVASYKTGSTTLQAGDVLGTSVGNYGLYLKEKISDYSFKVQPLGGHYETSVPITWKTTKNPVYSKNAFDMWGYFKGSVSDDMIAATPNLARITDPLSARNVDAWSLRTITTSLGAKINVDYESDTYGTNVMDNDPTLPLHIHIADKPNRQLIYKALNNTGVSLTELFKVNEKLDMVAIMSARADLTVPQDFPITLNSKTGMFTYAADFPKTSPLPSMISKPTSASFKITAIDPVNDRITVAMDDPYLWQDAVQVLYMPGYTVGLPYSSLNTRGYAQNGTANVFFKYKDGSGNPISYGGGTRVRSIRIAANNIISSVSYDYSNVNSFRSSGVNSYSPSLFQDNVYSKTNYYATQSDWQKSLCDRRYAGVLNSSVTKIISLSRDLPSPGVIYENVTLTSSVINALNGEAAATPGKTTYVYAVPQNWSTIFKELGSSGNLTSADGWTNSVIVNYNNCIGALRGVISYDNLGNKLHQTMYRTLYDELAVYGQDFLSNYTAVPSLSIYNYQGVIVDRYSNRKQLGTKRRASMVSRVYVPNILFGKTEIDYKAGITTREDYVAYDYYSGVPVQTKVTDGYGNLFVNKVIPAYRLFPDMGLKMTASANGGRRKHMLTQEAGNYTYKSDAAGNLTGIVSGNAQTWSNGVPVLLPDNSGDKTTQNSASAATSPGNVWRKQSVYQWAADGTSTSGITPLTSFADLNWLNPTASNVFWRKTAETTLYSVYSKELEEKNINELYATTKMDGRNEHVLYSGAPAKQEELAFCGVEDALVNGKFPGGILPGNGVIESSSTYPALNAHTGYSSLKTAPAQIAFSYLLKAMVNQKYVASVWAKAANNSLPDVRIYSTVKTLDMVTTTKELPATPVMKAGDWYLLKIFLPLNTSIVSASVGCKNTGTVDVYFDDFMVRPVNAATAAFVYDKFTNVLSYMINSNNLSTRYEYDTDGKLKTVYGEKIGIGQYKAGESEYHYKQ